MGVTRENAAETWTKAADKLAVESLQPAPSWDEVVDMRSPRLTIPALAAALALIVAACGGSGGGDGSAKATSSDGTPKPGGSITYALDGKTTNFCIPSAQLAISGIMISTAVYDTLTVPTQDPQKYAPYLAKDVQPNATFDQWTITLRPGVTFQDGTPVDAAAVKQNIEAWTQGHRAADHVLQHRRR